LHRIQVIIFSRLFRLPNDVSLPLDFFGILVVNVHNIIVGAVGGLEKLVELCVNSLGVPGVRPFE
jgi:hypothetical protein